MHDIAEYASLFRPTTSYELCEMVANKPPPHYIDPKIKRSDRGKMLFL